MKKLLVLMVVAVGMLSAGCTKVTEDTLVGVWKMTKMGKTMETLIPVVEGTGAAITLKFNEDKTAVAEYVIPNEAPQIDKGVWEYNMTTGVITIKEDADMSTFNVKSITTKNMLLEIPGEAFLFLVKQ